MPVESEEAYSTAIDQRKRLNELREKRYGGEPGYLLEHGVGAAETMGTMATNFAAAIPAAGVGVYEAISQDDWDKYAPAFLETQEMFTYEPRSFKGKEFVGNVGEFFQEYVEEPIQEHIVDPNIKINQPLVATVGHVEALVLLIPIKGGQMIAKKFGKGLGKKGEKLVDLDAKPEGTAGIGRDAVSGEYMAKDKIFKTGEEKAAERPKQRQTKTYEAERTEARLEYKPS